MIVFCTVKPGIRPMVVGQFEQITPAKAGVPFVFPRKMGCPPEPVPAKAGTGMIAEESN